MPEDQYQDFMEEIAKLHKRISEQYQLEDKRAEEEKKHRDEIKGILKDKLDPMYKVFVEGQNWYNVSVTLMKVFLVVTAVVGSIAALVRWLKH